ncbi:MAG: hypothetical protein QME66_08550 [Candidatus Eisenbacteria bacterium]|nr:hypothetical protein [Candidatus Eisenbacteria bacterium]
MRPERTTQVYSTGITAASKSALLEIMTALRAYHDALVLVGGWVPYFLLEEHRPPGDSFVHVGSIDIDLAVDPAQLSESQYATIVQLLRERGYEPAPDRLGDRIPNSFDRTIVSPIDRKSYTIRVDFLTHWDDPRPGEHRHLPVQDGLLARKTRGCETAFQHMTTFDLSGTLPGGGEITVPITIADVVGCLTMKGIVLGERYREKDAYDIYAVVAHYKQGPRDVATALRPCLSEPLVKEAIARIHTAFSTRESNGPAWVATFLGPASPTDRHRLITDAFMTIHELDVLLFNEQVSARPIPDGRSSTPQEEILRWKGRTVTVVTRGKKLGSTKPLSEKYRASHECRVEECTPHYVRLFDLATNEYASEPLGNVSITTDEAKHRLMLVVRER